MMLSTTSFATSRCCGCSRRGVMSKSWFGSSLLFFFETTETRAFATRSMAASAHVLQKGLGFHYRTMTSGSRCTGRGQSCQRGRNLFLFVIISFPYIFPLVCFFYVLLVFCCLTGERSLVVGFWSCHANDGHAVDGKCYLPTAVECGPMNDAAQP